MRHVEIARNFLRSRTGRLAGTYLAIIMIMTLVFSIVIFTISSSQFDRPAPPRGGLFDDSFNRSTVQRLFEQRADEARANLAFSLAFLNLVTLTGGSFLSYVLARKTLQPIEAAMEQQSRFVSDASHELRTPLTALQATNEVALRKRKLNLEQAKDVMAQNVEEVTKLRHLTDGLLGLVKQESATHEAPESFGLRALVDSVASTYQPVASKKAITIDTSSITDQTLVANRTAVSQILGTFVDNAITYSPEGTTVTIDALVSGTSIVISVTDRGIGIAPEHQAKVFDRFWRADDSRSSRHESGNGLGLAIAKAAADRNGYHIALDSEHGKGTSFHLELPTGA